MSVRVIDLSNTYGEHEIMLDREGMELKIVGAFHVRRGKQENVQLRVVHAVPHTRATTDLRGVVDARASLQIVGTIVIHENAIGTHSFLSERVLLLDKTSRAEVIPNLEIKTDDVKCSHASTVSSIPEEQLFYLKSRGIRESAARQLIVDGVLHFPNV